MKTDKQIITTALDRALEMSRYAWQRREQQNNPWETKIVIEFVDAADRAGYIFQAYNYPFDGHCITNEWERLWAWAESIAQNERDTLAGR